MPGQILPSKGESPLKADLGRAHSLIPSPGANKIQVPRMKRGVIFLLLGLLIILILIILFTTFAPFLLKPQKKTDEGPGVTFPVSSPFPVPPVSEFFNPSIYATDQDILRLEGAVKTVDKDLNSVVLHETELNPPLLLLEINFRNE